MNATFWGTVNVIIFLIPDHVVDALSFAGAALPTCMIHLMPTMLRSRSIPSSSLDSKTVLPLAVTAAALLLTYLYIVLRYKRFKQYADLPQMEASLLWGHWKHIYRFIQSGKQSGHPGRFLISYCASKLIAKVTIYGRRQISFLSP